MPRNRGCIKRTIDSKSAVVFFIFSFLWFVFSYEQALAHRAMIFAWVDGDTIHTQCKLSGGKKVKGGNVIVFDPEGTLLLEGKTDENGMFSFRIPQRTELKIVLKASMGHQAEWTIRSEEFMTTESENNTSETVKTASVEKNFDSKGVETNEKASEHINPGLEKEEIQKIIDASLDRKLAPVMDMMTKTYDQGPGLTEIMGGIGYIIGLVGIALYFSNRRKRD